MVLLGEYAEHFARPKTLPPMQQKEASTNDFFLHGVCQILLFCEEMGFTYFSAMYLQIILIFHSLFHLADVLRLICSLDFYTA